MSVVVDILGAGRPQLPLVGLAEPPKTKKSILKSNFGVKDFCERYIIIVETH